MSSADLEKSIQFEAEPYIPFDIKEVNISTHIVRDVVEENVAKMETVLVAAKKDILQERMHIIETAGLKPLIIDVDAFAIENSYEANHDGTGEEPGTVMLLNIGASTSNINILEKGSTKVVRDLFIGGSSITNAVQKGLQVDFNTAEKMKKEKGVILPDEENAAVDENDIQFSMSMMPVLQELVGEIQRSIDYYQAPTEGEMRVEKIVLSGGTALLKNIDRFFSKELNIPVEINDPFSNISTKGASGDWEEYAPIFAVAMGLALRLEGDLKK
jgi:type IV pilus assembly protein PilM